MDAVKVRTSVNLMLFMFSVGCLGIRGEPEILASFAFSL